MRLNALIKRVEKVGNEMESYIQKGCQARKVWIVNQNKDQLKEGLNADGNLMNGGYYSKKHSMARLRRGLAVDHVYLSFEGDLQSKMIVEFGAQGFSIKSTDWKQQLVDEVMRTEYWPTVGESPWYGHVFGLTEENKKELGRLIAPRVMKRVRRMLLNH